MLSFIFRSKMNKVAVINATLTSPIMTTILLSIAAGVMVGSVLSEAGKQRTHKEEKEKQMNLRMQQQKIKSRFFDILPLQTAAFNICRDWTNSKCKEEKDFILMAELYAKEQALECDMIQSKSWFSRLERKPAEELKVLNNYQRAFLHFYTQTVDYQNIPSIINLSEFEKFLTLHWTLYMTDNIMKPDINNHYWNIPLLYHRFALKEIFRRSPSDGERIKKMQLHICPHFHKIRAQLGLPCPPSDP